MIDKNIIVAFGYNNEIGKCNKMPWHIKADMDYFKTRTMGHPVIMGRKTYESIGKPLPGRTNIVLSHKYIDGVINVDSLEEAYKKAEEIDTQCFIIGGASLYNKCINDADYIYATRVYTTVENADTFFPEIDETVWRQMMATQVFIDKKSGIGYQFIIYTRR